MALLAKILVYGLFLAIGTFVGLLLNGRFVRYTIHFDGIPASRLTASQIDEILRRSPNAMEQRTSLVVDGNTIFSVDGQWLMWLIVLGSIVLFGFIAHMILKWRLRHKTEHH